MSTASKGQGSKPVEHDEDQQVRHENPTPSGVATNEADEGDEGKETAHHGLEEVPMTFPQRLMEILSNDANEDIVKWLPHGKGFLIVDKKRFATEFLPKFFSRKSKYTSFTRKLNRWNFTRVTRGPESGAYYHPMFQRGDNGLCMQMSCIHGKASQNLEPMNPVALGLGVQQQADISSASTPMMMMMMAYPDPQQTDPLVMARLAEQQRQQYFQFCQMNMAAMGQQQQQQQQMGQPSSENMMESNKNNSNADTDSTARINDDKNNNVGALLDQANADANASMIAFQQQQQYFGMMMAQQAALGGVMPTLPINQHGYPFPQQQAQQQQQLYSPQSLSQQDNTLQSGDTAENGMMEPTPL